MGPAAFNIGLPEILILGSLVAAVVVVYMFSSKNRKDE